MSQTEATFEDHAEPQPTLGRRAIGVVAFALIFALAFELTVRIEDYLRFGAPFTSSIRSVSDLVVRDALGMHGRANAVFEKWRMNNLGTRGPDVDLQKGPGTIRVVVVGASESFGLYESPGNEYPRQLEARLNALPVGEGCPDTIRASFQVLNAAMPGMSLPTIAQDVRLRLRAWEPDVVVVYPTPVQYLDDQLPVAASPDSSGTKAAESPLAFLEPRGAGRLRSAFKSVIPERILDLGRRAIVRQARSGTGAVARFDAIPADRLGRFASNLTSLIAEIRDIGAEPVVVAHLNAFTPNARRDPVMMHAWERFYPSATGDVIVAFDSAARPLTAATVRSSGARLVDAAEKVGAQRTAAFADYAHFTDAGAAALAGAITEVLVPSGSRGCLAPASSPGARPEP